MRGSKTAMLTVAADGVGVVSAALGGYLTVAPQTGGRRLGLTATDAAGRARSGRQTSPSASRSSPAGPRVGGGVP